MNVSNPQKHTLPLFVHPSSLCPPQPLNTAIDASCVCEAYSTLVQYWWQVSISVTVLCSGSPTSYPPPVLELGMELLNSLVASRWKVYWSAPASAKSSTHCKTWWCNIVSHTEKNHIVSYCKQWNASVQVQSMWFHRFGNNGIRQDRERFDSENITGINTWTKILLEIIHERGRYCPGYTNNILQVSW